MISKRWFYILTAITLTNVVLPEYCSPTSVSSISSFQNRLLNQSNILLITANILPNYFKIIFLLNLILIRFKNIRNNYAQNIKPEKYGTYKIIFHYLTTTTPKRKRYKAKRIKYWQTTWSDRFTHTAHIWHNTRI